ncbi:MAG: hypothetical protein ACRECQ_01420, partial [Burkholderiaceae bacterium]
AGIAGSLPDLPRRTKKKQSHGAESSSAEQPPMIAATALNPAAWWNALQDQFTRVSAGALEAPASKPASSARAAKKRAKKRTKRAAKVKPD